MDGLHDHVAELRQRGFAWIRGWIGGATEAFGVARELIDAAGDRPLSVVGDFVLPPSDGPPSRDFQTLHFDFGVPLEPKVPRDVGCFTALHIPSDAGTVSAVTRIVPLAALLSQRAWPLASELLERVVEYGRTHGAWDDANGYDEGSLARVVEAAAGSAHLPSVKTEPGFLCGMEFDSLRAEHRFFERHGLQVDDVEREVTLSPGDLLVFDNLAVAHGRRGIRRPGELRQWVFGERSVASDRQRQVRDAFLAAFTGQ
jgi:hypothetical protein